MSMIEKNKSLFVVTLDNGKQTYFDFTDGKIYGVSGKAVQNFNNEARKILKAESDNNFLAQFFYERTLSFSFLRKVSQWSPSMVETLYSLFASHYSVQVLGRLAEFCYNNSYTLDKKGIKILTNSLHAMEDADGNIAQLNESALKSQIMTAIYSDIPQFIIDIIVNLDDEEMRSIIVSDAKKIAFRYEHENWNFLNDDYWYSKSIRHYLVRYIKLCELLHKERTYKNLYLSICQMEKEKDLMADSICADYQQNAPLFFEDENFTVIIPTTAGDFKKEADYQQNCVFRMYYPKVKNCETHVVFIRRKDNVNTPYITCEIGNNGKIIQYLGRFNQYVTDDNALAFKENYQHFLHEHF